MMLIVCIIELIPFELDFYCTNDSHCNGHGVCKVHEGKCRCDEDWNLELDCSSKDIFSEKVIQVILSNVF